MAEIPPRYTFHIMVRHYLKETIAINVFPFLPYSVEGKMGIYIMSLCEWMEKWRRRRSLGKKTNVVQSNIVYEIVETHDVLKGHGMEKRSYVNKFKIAINLIE